VAGQRPNISVVMPVFNGARFVASAIESIQNQTLGDFEFIIVDDGSTDRTPDILKAYAQRDPRIRLVRQDNAGIVGALNRGIEEARAPLLARMDADDVSRPNRLEVQVRFLAGAADCSVVGSAVRLIDEKGQGDRVIRYPRYLNNLREAVVAGRILAHPTAVMRRQFLEKIGGYRRVLEGVEDTDLWLRLVAEGPIANVDEVLLDYRMHPAKVTAASTYLTRVKESVARGLAYERLCGLPERDLQSDSIFDLAIGFAARAVDKRFSCSNPWMDARRTRRILRDILKLDPTSQEECRGLLSSLAAGQLKRLKFIEAAKTFFYRYRWD
jgi:glycosyltransferase involved in cell wall biosynthesis